MASPAGGGNLLALNSGGIGGPGNGGGTRGDQIRLPADRPSGGPNALTRPGGEGPDSPAAPTRTGRRGPMDDLMAQHDHAKSVYETISKARNMLEHMRREMDQLTNMGDTVQPTDVIAAAGRVVGHGVNAKDMATILSDMPPMGGQGLAVWLAQHDQAIQQQEMHAEMMQSLAGHNMGQAALKVLAGLHIAQRGRQAISGMTARMGALSPRPTMAPPGQGPAMTNVLQTQQRPDMEGPGAEEAV